MAESTTTPAAVAWLVAAKADVRGALAAWDRGDLAPVPVGVAWDVVRLPRRIGWRAVRRLRAEDSPLGPVLHTATHIEVLVPRGTARSWCAPPATTLSRGDVIAAPAPGVVAPLTLRTRSWIVAPTAPLTLTDPAALLAAYSTAQGETAGVTP
ncbi:hypothetical protein RB200_08555 [Streptomyces sp. PmtG]